MAYLRRGVRGRAARRFVVAIVVLVVLTLVLVQFAKSNSSPPRPLVPSEAPLTRR